MDLSLMKLRYPIGKADIKDNITAVEITNWIKVLEDFPFELESLVSPLTDMQLDTPYRAGGWTVRQVVHHLADSHANSYIRFKWALTEESPTIKAYFEDRWAELPDSLNGPVDLSLDLLKSLHAKWVLLLKGLSQKELKREFVHPESNDPISLERNIGLYAWHCKHHLAHITSLLKEKGWH